MNIKELIGEGSFIVEILKGLDQWRNERKLEIKGQAEGYFRNTFEELGELADAMKVEAGYKNIAQKLQKALEVCQMARLHGESLLNVGKSAALVGKYEKAWFLKDAHYIVDEDELRRIYGREAFIDALCDIMVFSGNLLASGNYKLPNDEVLGNLKNTLENVQAGGDVKARAFQELTGGVSMLSYSVLSADSDDEDTSFIITSIYASLKVLAQDKGYDFDLAMQEVIRHINSRRGSWSDALGKWVKDESEEAVKLWYQPNFSNASIL